MIPKCFYCENLTIANRLIAPIDNGHPHIDGMCQDCPFENPYNEYQKVQPI